MTSLPPSEYRDLTPASTLIINSLLAGRKWLLDLHFNKASTNHES